ncbi:MAG: site-specific integrase, partial [Mycobacterium sp.]
MITTQTRRPRRSWGKLRRRTSGRWEASYEHNLSRHSAPITFTAKMDGEAWLASERRLIEQGEWTPPKLRAAATTNRG